MGDIIGRFKVFALAKADVHQGPSLFMTRLWGRLKL